jgi:hypothetical protein
MMIEILPISCRVGHERCAVPGVECECERVMYEQEDQRRMYEREDQDAAP